jgi:site-specific DNA-methyltransferase (adenine-specific)
MTASECDRIFCGGTTNWSWFEGRPTGQRAPTPETFSAIAKAWPELAPLAAAVAEAEREVVGTDRKATLKEHVFFGDVDKAKESGRAIGYGEWDITAPTTEAAKQWEGWGTALKPALEPITVARKPLVGTVAANVLEWGTGGINVDGCRVTVDRSAEPREYDKESASGMNCGDSGFGSNLKKSTDFMNSGRFPANLLHDGSEEVVGLFPYTHGHGSKQHSGSDKGMFDWGTANRTQTGGESGSAARFFYCAKASKKDRDEGLEGFEEKRKKVAVIQTKGVANDGDWEDGKQLSSPMKNHHPTVKPTDLMRYLCRLVTPPGGIVLDPFMGSGSTGKAAKLEGFQFIGIEREAEYMEIAKARIEHGNTSK